MHRRTMPQERSLNIVTRHYLGNAEGFLILGRCIKTSSLLLPKEEKTLLNNIDQRKSKKIEKSKAGKIAKNQNTRRKDYFSFHSFSFY